jgi:hypothetical protein
MLSKHSHAKRNKIAQWKRVVNVEYVVINWSRNVSKMNVTVVQIFTLDLDQNKSDKSFKNSI